MGKFHAWVHQELTPYVNALAWWQAVPVDPPRTLSSAQEGARRTAPPERKSRLESKREELKQPLFEPDMPEICGEMGYLVAALFEAGPVSAVGMGGGVLTWSDMAAWEAGTGHELLPWERQLLRALSADYVKQSRAAEKPDCPNPYRPDGSPAPVLSAAAADLKARLRALAAL